MANESGWSTIVSFDTIDPNVSDWSTIVSFTTGNWPYPGITQPRILYGSVIVYFPTFVNWKFWGTRKQNYNKGLDGSIEVIRKSNSVFLEIEVKNIYQDPGFLADFLTFWDYAIQGSSFTFDSGESNARIDRIWWLRDDGYRARWDRGGGRNIKLVFMALGEWSDSVE